MTNTVAVQDRTVVEDLGLPNKFTYPEFAGFAGEKLLREIILAILPYSLHRTWEILEAEHAYGNDCFLALAKVAEKARRTLRTVNRNIASLCAKGLLVLRSEYKFFHNADGSLRKKAVVVKDFSSLYSLAHEYYLWMHSENYIEPEREYIELIKQDECLLAKLRRFEDYRRLLYNQRPGPVSQEQEREENRWFTAYREGEDAGVYHIINQIKDAFQQQSGLNQTKYLSKELPKNLPKVSKERISEKDYNNCLSRDSYDSEEHSELRREANPSPHVCNQKQASIAQDYMKGAKEYKTSDVPSNESLTNHVLSSSKNNPARAGKTRESAEIHPDIQNARQAMAVAGVEPRGFNRQQTKGALPPPPKHPFACSFVHEVAGFFGDLNEKGSKTVVERIIEAFELEPSAVLLCLVRAYVIARDTKDEKIRHRRPETGLANRMPLFCSMVKTFARALVSGNTWEYTWERMIKDIEADERLSLWLVEQQGFLSEDQATGSQTTEVPETVEPSEEEEVQQEAITHAQARQDAPVLDGWTSHVAASDEAAYLVRELAQGGYGDLEVRVVLPESGHRYQVWLLDAAGDGYSLVSEDDIDFIVNQARSRTFSIGPSVQN